MANIQALRRQLTGTAFTQREQVVLKKAIAARPSVVGVRMARKAKKAVPRPGKAVRRTLSTLSRIASAKRRPKVSGRSAIRSALKRR